ncbi:hypothetical protein KW798_00295 [Candidatus Parcubacteria bacterium]|nr:hypothetical protein [Candidatus Parcubacteria bacterium]
MNTILAVTTFVLGIAASGIGLFIVFGVLFAGLLSLIVFWWKQVHKPLGLARINQNPILEPDASHWWESEAVFNPAALYEGGKVHLLYRALGHDGISRIGYASSSDGIHFERYPYPVFELHKPMIPDPRRVYGPLTYHPGLYASGGGWGGAEDPRMVMIDDRVYMTFTAFQGWDSARIGLTSVSLQNFLRKSWYWRMPSLISPPHEVHKNWLIFPEKINDHYAVLNSISPKIAIEYIDDLSKLDDPDVYLTSPGRSGGRKGYWDSEVRGAGAPPVKTKDGWLLFYHANGYKVGAMLLDLKDPTKILYRSSHPVLEANEWYENDGKPGITYVSGAVVIGDDLIVYYGGGDKRIAAASVKLDQFLNRLATGEHASLEPVKL